jgi:heat shock protein HslJ
LKKHTFLFQILAVLLFISCSAWAQKTKKKSLPVLSGTYQLVKMRNQNTLEAIEPGKTNIVIDTKANQFSANVGCNSISGEFKTKKNKILPLKLMQTEMFCADNKIETPFVQHLMRVNAYVLTSKQLSFCEGKKVLLVLKKKK